MCVCVSESVLMTGSCDVGKVDPRPWMETRGGERSVDCVAMGMFRMRTVD